MNNYIVRPYRFIIVVTRSVIRRTINTKIIFEYLQHTINMKIQK